MAIKLEMLRVFRTVAEHGSLSGAAAQLGRTPSAISMMLAQLEANIGAPLFETDRKNRLTKLGAMILAEAIRSTDVFDSSSRAIQRLTTSIAGTVRIAAVPSVITTLLPAAIAQFQKARPQVRLEISDLDSASVRRRVRMDDADIGILTASDDAPGDGILIAREALGIVYAKGGAIDQAMQSERIRPSWSLLQLEPLISNPLCARVQHPDVAERLETCNLEARNTTALLSFVQHGLGATILPKSAASILSDGLGFVEPQDPNTQRDLRMICSPDRNLSPAAQEFWAALS